MQTLSRTTLRASIAAAAMTASVLVAPAALATEGGAEAPNEDPRAEMHEGNVSSCDALGLGGTKLDGSEYTATGGVPEKDQYVTIESVSNGITLTAIVVKGGPAYNVYVPGERGLPAEPAWEQLRSPLNPGGNIPAISHWFACGKSTPDTTEPKPPADGDGTTEPTGGQSTPPATTTPGDSTPPSSTTSEPVAATPTTGETAGPAATSTTASAAPVVNSAGTEALAYTGFSNAWLIWFGGGLVLAGAAVLVLLRFRRSRG